MTRRQVPDDDVAIDRVTRQVAGSGKWVLGRVGAFRFEALVFPAPALNPDWELPGGSRISKLRLCRVADGRTVFNFDRGLDVDAPDAAARAAVERLAAELADRVYGGSGPEPGGPAAMPDVPHLGFASAREAIEFARENQPVAILIGRRHVVVSRADADRLAAAGVEFAFVHERDGRVITVPVNG